MLKRNNQFDCILLGISIILILFGVLILTSASAPFSQIRYGNTYYFLKHQLFFGLIPGIILAFLVFKINLNFFKKWALFLLLINLLLMILVFIPGIGCKTGGAVRWICFGPFSFQPSEFLKLTFIFYCSAWITSRIFEQEKCGKNCFKKGLFGSITTFIAFLAIIAIISVFLILQPNISTLTILVAIIVLMYFLSSTPLWHTILIFLLGIISMIVLMTFTPYRFNRLLVFLNPETDPMGIGYQIKQSLIAVGSGEIFGLGFGMSRQKFGFLPEPISDSIFAIFAEETGFIGCLIIILFFLAFLWRGFKIARNSNDKFSQLTAFGITLWILIQSFANIGAMTGILPLSGIPLPFLSYGGSHLIAELMGIGILLNISKQTK